MRISRTTAAWILLMLSNLIGLSLGELMRITSFTVDGPNLAIPGSTLTLHCNVTGMDASRFVQFGKLLPSDQTVKVIFSTNMNVEQSIRSIERYVVSAKQFSTGPWGQTPGQDSSGFDFMLKINDVRLEDAGMYFCSIPSLDQNEYLEISVFAEPQSIDLYVDGVRVADKTHFTFESSSTHEIRCQAKGSYPQAIFQFTLGGDISNPHRDRKNDLFGPQIDDGEEGDKFESHLTSHQVTTVPVPSYPEFFAHTTYTTTAVIKEAFIDYFSAGRPITCSARIPGWASAKSLATSFTPVFTGWAPEFSCKRFVMASPGEGDVTVKCIVHAKPAVSEIYVYYFGTPSPFQAESVRNVSDVNKNASSNPLSTIHNLYPTRHSRQAPDGEQGSQRGRTAGPGGKQYSEYYDFEKDVEEDDEEIDDEDHDSKHRVTVNKRDQESTVIELSIDITTEDEFRDYYFVASNKYGTSLHIVTLLQDPAHVAAQIYGSSAVRVQPGINLSAVVTLSAAILILFAPSNCMRTL